MRYIFTALNIIVFLATAFFIIMLIHTKDIKYVNYLLFCAFWILAFGVQGSQPTGHYKTIYDENPWGYDD
jgi:hypothetical protein